MVQPNVSESTMVMGKPRASGLNVPGNGIGDDKRAEAWFGRIPKALDRPGNCEIRGAGRNPRRLEVPRHVGKTDT